jgi:2'-5' RNA ligase
MSDTVRTFVAIRLPQDVLDVIADVIGQLDNAGVRGLRTVRPEGVHLTLKFLGNIPASKIEPVIAAVTQAVGGHSGFELVLGGAGSFPSRGSPRVLWLGVEGDMEPLNALQQSVEDALSALGFKREQRGFNPHLTLARIREGSHSEDCQRALESLMSIGLPLAMPIPVSSVHVMKTTLHPQGAIHESLSAASLRC